MNKQTIKTPATAALVIETEHAFVLGAAKADATVASWFATALDARRGGFSKDEKGAVALQKAMQGELVEAAVAFAMKAKKDGGLGLRKKAIEDVGSTWFKILGLVVAPSRVNTYRAYFSGIARAHAHEMPWNSRAHLAVDKGGLPDVPWKGKAQGATDGGVAQIAKVPEAGATVSVDPAKREVRFTAGSKGTDPESVAKIVTAIGSDPGRVALALAYCKAQGWI